MYNYNEISDIHLELTSKCQARCPMCPRRINGGPINPLIEISEIDLETFKLWFSVDFIKQLNSLSMCGNLGDPIMAQDCLEIYLHLRETNPNIHLSLHTNGSARTRRFWEQLAELNVRVTFGIDGLEDTHKLYRIDTHFDKIIENANTFIRHGGNAEWNMLVFEHNEHQIGACQHMADMMGFKKFAIKHTSRFVENKLHVINDRGNTTHILYPTVKSKNMIPKIVDSLKVEKPCIKCKAQQNKSLYISANGAVSPCCWLDFSWILPRHESRVDYMDRIDMLPTLADQTLEEIFDSGVFRKIEETWKDKPLRECARQCGTFDKLGAQFE